MPSAEKAEHAPPVVRVSLDTAPSSELPTTLREADPSHGLAILVGGGHRSVVWAVAFREQRRVVLEGQGVHRRMCDFAPPLTEGEPTF
jgi:hypothetical protein